MDGGDSVLDAIFEEENMDDVDMVDVEEGEFVETGQPTDLKEKNGEDDFKMQSSESQSQSKNRRRRTNKKKNKKRKRGAGENFTDINRFVLDTCRRLREKKSYMVYNAVGCLGVSALSEFVKEIALCRSYFAASNFVVDAIQACGGQMTADGKRFRTGGGILWNIIKTREPNAYKEIMEKAKEFEKQFKQNNVKKVPAKKTDDSSNGIICESTSVPADGNSDGLRSLAHIEERHGEPSGETKRLSVHDRMRAPVSYDDDLLADNPADRSN